MLRNTRSQLHRDIYICPQQGIKDCTEINMFSWNSKRNVSERLLTS